MRHERWVLVLAAVGVLAACSSKEPDGAAAPATEPVGTVRPDGSKVSATADEVAKAARGNLKCPPKIATPARAPGAPVDDVVGVRPGMTFDEAAAVVMCSNELMVVTPDNSRGFQIQTYGQTLRQGFNARLAEEKVEKTSEQIIEEMQDAAMARGSNRVVRDLQPGQSKWYVGTIGVPGQERVLSAAREEWFAAGRNPTVASVEQALREKYGTPTRTQEDSGNRWLTWAYDPFGRLITETSPLLDQCNGQASPDSGVNLSPDCGIVVAARIGAMGDNPSLAEYLQASVVDKANGYEALTATEQALQTMENQRRAEQVQDAAENADAPQL
jgi:YD repeat-containing protein